MRQELSLNLMDTHAGGDVSRIVLGFYWRSPTAFRKCRWI